MDGNFIKSKSFAFLTDRNNLNLVTGELKNPHKNLPKATVIGPSIVIVCYLLANIAYYARLPEDVIVSSTTLAMVRHVFLFSVLTPDRILERLHSNL